MNFLHILRKFGFIFFAFSCVTFSGPILSNGDFQELGQPYLSVYIPGPYQYVQQYNSIVQDHDGFLYIGSGKGVLRYDGDSWKLIPAEDRVSLLSNGSQILIYSQKQIGFLEHGPAGTLLIRMLAAENNFRGNVIQALRAGKKTYILTTHGLYCWNGKIEKIGLSFLPEAIFSEGQSLILYSASHGLMHLNQEKAEQWIPSYEIPLNHLTSLLHTGKKWILIDGRENAIAVFEQGETRLGFGQIDQVLENTKFSCLRTLSNGNIAWGTRMGGVHITDPQGRILQSINQDDGLYDNRVTGLWPDASNNLWVLHEQAISRIEIPSAFSFFKCVNGFTVNIKDLIRFKGTLYAATNKGLYQLDKKSSSIRGLPDKNHLLPVPLIPDNCRQLIIAGENLIIATSRGVFELEGENATTIYSKSVNTISYSTEHDILIIAGINELILLRGANWSERVFLSWSDHPIHQMFVSKDGHLWLSSRYGDISRSMEPLDQGLTPAFNRVDFDYPDEYPEDQLLFFSLSGEIRCIYEGVQIYDPVSNQFIPDDQINLSWIREKHHVSEISKDNNGKLWVSTIDPESGNSEFYYTQNNKPAYSSWQQVCYRRYNNQIINCIYPDDKGLIWIGSSGGLTRFDATRDLNNTSSFMTHISSVVLPNDSILHYDYLNSEEFHQEYRKKWLRIPHSKNQIRFHYLSTDFNSESNPLFQYKISGLQEEWSPWSNNRSAEFNDLAKGRYTFRVRSQDIFGAVSESDSFQFRIMPPLYASFWAILIYCLLFLFLLYAFQKWRTFQHVRERYKLEEIIEERTEALMKEKEKTDTLLANILPKKTAEELKSKGKATSSKFKMVTVLFADIQGFTKIAEQMNPDRLIDELDQFYFHFDSVVEKYNIEKIKTIGDAYMAAGGIPIKNKTNPVEVVLAALEMQHYMQELKKTKTDIWDLRIGIHTGSVIAGVVGQKKLSYDIWGDSVNTASRMESSGEIGKVNISDTTYKLVKDFFNCEYRGKMPVKYKGDIEMYFVSGLKKEFAKEDRYSPNENFITQIQLLRLPDLEEYLVQRMDLELPDDLYFHNSQHTIHVYNQVELLGRGEKVPEEDLLVLKTAALLHDIGYIDQFDGHEERSVELAREILPMYSYAENQIDRICRLILATKIPYEPADILEKIMIDANLDHLGRVDFLIQSDKLFQEYRIRDKVKTKKDWNHAQIEFLKQHDFHTDIASKVREVSREEQIENIRKFS